jgi:hypothetical protein
LSNSLLERPERFSIRSVLISEEVACYAVSLGNTSDRSVPLR